MTRDQVPLMNYFPCRWFPILRAWIRPLVGLVLAALVASPLSGETVEGFAEPFHRVDIAGATEPGMITEIRVREGDHVKKGDVLATLENGVLEASLVIAERRSQMRGRLDAANAELHMRRDRAFKLRQLRAQGHASPVELERAEADFAVAAAQVVLAREELELAELECRRIEAQIEQRIFRSPINGVVSEIVREQGESILLNDPALMTLVQLNPLRVRFPVSVHAAQSIQADQVLEVEVPDLKENVEAKVDVIAPVL
ncbi:MAG TPA: efflux RND transporter periplasmic adaptor subunit, partial [Pirellulaceae bacterium]